MNERHIGSDFDDFLKDEGILEEIELSIGKKYMYAVYVSWETCCDYGEDHLIVFASNEDEAWEIGIKHTKIDVNTFHVKRLVFKIEQVGDGVYREGYDEGSK